jgi:hypothetical protein
VAGKSMEVLMGKSYIYIHTVYIYIYRNHLYRYINHL